MPTSPGRPSARQAWKMDDTGACAAMKRKLEPSVFIVRQPDKLC